MSKYIKLFNQHSQYEAFIGGGEITLPNVSHCIDVNDVHYNPIPHDYSKDYLTFVSRASNVTFTFNGTTVNDVTNKASYSLDDGVTWTEIESGAETPSVKRGKKILWRGEMTPTNNGIGTFTATKEFDVEGNAMSLLFGDNFKGQTSLSGKNYVLRALFRENTNVLNAENLSLPATTLANDCYTTMFAGCTSLTTAPSELPATILAENCYQGMFGGCTSLTTAPELPATTLTQGCYTAMFYGCTSLTTAPELPATTLANDCYTVMFYGCTSLTTAPQLPATTLASNCYNSMFADCTSLTTAPSKLPATTLAEGCYQYMFNGCTSLTTAPELPATTLADSCYYLMFADCTSLTTAPSELPATTLADYCYFSMFGGCTSLTTAPSELPATTLAEDCYGSMFYGCTSLTTAPQLPATTLVSGCYSSMFEGCSSLNYIKAMFTTTPDATYTGDWVFGVSSNGTFVKNSAATWNVTGVNGIPNGWTVVPASE